jgi:hypothetical protein
MSLRLLVSQALARSLLMAFRRAGISILDLSSFKSTHVVQRRQFALRTWPITLSSQHSVHCRSSPEAFVSLSAPTASITVIATAIPCFCVLGPLRPPVNTLGTTALHSMPPCLSLSTPTSSISVVVTVIPCFANDTSLSVRRRWYWRTLDEGIFPSSQASKGVKLTVVEESEVSQR